MPDISRVHAGCDRNGVEALIDRMPGPRYCDTEQMSTHEEFISWQTLWDRTYPLVDISPEDNAPPGDYLTVVANRLRGRAIVQALRQRRPREGKLEEARYR